MLEWSLSDSLIALLQQRQQLQRWFRILAARAARRRRSGECEIGDGVLGEWETATHNCLLMKKMWRDGSSEVTLMYECFLFFFPPFVWLEASFASAEPPDTSVFLRNFLLEPQWWPCGKTGDFPSENLAKYGYQPNMKFKSLIILLCIWLHTGNQI